MHLYPYLALELANERAQEADRHRLALLARGGHTPPSLPRRLAAHTLAWLSRSTAVLVRRLDDRVADDLADTFGAERLAPSR